MARSPLAVLAALTLLMLQPAGASAGVLADWLSGRGALDAESLALVAAAALGIDASGPGSAYEVWLSGRTLLFRARDLGVDGLGPLDFAFGAYVPGRGWVLLPHTAYDDLAVVDGVAYALLDDGVAGPETRVAVKLPRLQPVEAPGGWDPRPPFGAGGVVREIRVEYKGAVAYIYLFTGVPEPYRSPAYYDSIGVDRLWGLSAREPPALAVEALQAGLAVLARHLALAYAIQPLDASSGGVRVAVGPPEPVPDDGAVGDVAAVIDSRPIWGGHLYGDTGYILVGREGVTVGIPVIIPGVHDDVYVSWTGARIYLWVQPGSPNASYAIVTVHYFDEDSGAWVEAAAEILYNHDLPRPIVVDITRYGPDPWEDITLKITASPGSWPVTVGPVFVKYVVSLGDWGLPLGADALSPTDKPPWYAVNYSLNILPPDPWVIRIRAGENAGLAVIPFKAPAYGGVAILRQGEDGGAVYVQGSTYFSYRVKLRLHATDPGAGYDSPVRVSAFLRGVEVCDGEEVYVAPGGSATGECSWVFYGQNTVKLMEEPGYVIFVAWVEEPPPRDIVVTVSVESVELSNGFVRRLLDLWRPVRVLTSMLPNGEPDWFVDNKFYTLTVASSTGLGTHYAPSYRLAPALLRVDVEALGPGADIGCGTSGRPSGLDVLRFSIEASGLGHGGRGLIEYDGITEAVEYHGARPDRLVFTLRLDNASLTPHLVDVTVHEPGGAGPERPPSAPALTVLVHPEAGLAVGLLDTVVWALSKVAQLESNIVEVKPGGDGRSVTVTVDFAEAAAGTRGEGGAARLEVVVNVGLSGESCGGYTATWSVEVAFDPDGPFRQPTTPPTAVAGGTVHRDVD